MEIYKIEVLLAINRSCRRIQTYHARMHKIALFAGLLRNRKGSICMFQSSGLGSIGRC